MQLGTKVAYNTIIQVASKVVTTALGLLAVAIMTRYLGTAGFGEYTTIITFLALFGVLADLGLTLVTVQMISQAGVDEKKILDNLFSLRLLTAIVFLGAAPIAAWFFPYNHDIKIGIIITVFSFFFIALNQIFTAIFQKYLRMDKVSLAETASRLVLLGGTIAAVRFDFGLSGVLVSIVAGSFVQFILLYLFSRKFARLGFAFDLSLWREVAQKSWPLAVTIFFNLIYLKTDTLILSLMKSQSDVGIYGAAYKVIDILTTIPFIFAGVVLPILAADWSQRAEERFRKILQKSFDLMVILAVPLVVGTQILAQPVMVLVAGQDFAAAGTVLKILIFAAGFVFTSSFLAHVMIALNKQQKIIPAYIFTAVTSVIGYLIFIPRFSYFGAAAITVYSEAVITLFMIWYAFRYAKFFPRLKILGKSVLAALVMGAALAIPPAGFYQHGWCLLSAIGAAVAIYFVALYLVRGIGQKDLALLLNQEPRENEFL
ncbi:MAG: flippase [Patescibacteria group bacterium]|nr:flippase [Patescibacteria group bacterium]